MRLFFGGVFGSTVPQGLGHKAAVQTMQGVAPKAAVRPFGVNGHPAPKRQGL